MCSQEVYAFPHSNDSASTCEAFVIGQKYTPSGDLCSSHSLILTCNSRWCFKGVILPQHRGDKTTLPPAPVLRALRGQLCHKAGTAGDYRRGNVTLLY